MARTITIRRTVTGPLTTFSADFNITAAASVTLEETIPDTARADQSGALIIKVPVPNDATAYAIKAVLLECTGEISSIIFKDSTNTLIGTVDVTTLNGSGTAYIVPPDPNEVGANLPDTFKANNDIWTMEVLRPSGVSGENDLTLFGLFLYDPTF